MYAKDFCQYEEFKCTSFDQIELTFHLCEDNLNRLACLNIKTIGQNCYWDS